MPKEKRKIISRDELLKIIKRAKREGLKTLHLSGEGISELPDEISQLANLQWFDLSGNQLTSLPESISQLASLQTLDLSDNQLTSLPESISQLANLQTLSLFGNQLTFLPESIGQLTKLQWLDLSRNRLTSLPESISQLINLQTLNLSNNQLTSLPESIGQLTKLQWLNLSRNQLASLPESISQLANLWGLDLSHNQLTSLPESISQLANLQRLGLSFNQLTSLPESISQLANLQRLYLSNNQLTSLPESIGQLANLQWLYISNNQLTSLPESISQLANLQILDLSNNPLNPALQSAYQGGMDALMAYLRSLEDKAKKECLYEAKLLLVGEGDVGKTTLLKAMTGKSPKKGEPTTHGVNIDVHALHLPHPDKTGVEIKLNAWDFGGQEVYRVTHQFFFSPRSIYLLVWEPRRGVQQCQVEDWLKMIRLRVGDDAKVIIVSTYCKTGEHIARIDKPIFMRDFGSMIVGFHEVDSLVPDPKTGQMVGVAELKTLIAQTAKDLEIVGIPFNRDWREARDELLKLGETNPRISYQEFTTVCQRHGLASIDTKTLSGLMHDLGYIVYYGDDERLKDDVVLQPEWLTKAIGFVLEDRVTQEMDGILPDKRLKEVWLDNPADGKTSFDPSLYPFFLRLMERFDVSYRLEDGANSLVAQHVPQVRPDLPWLPEIETISGNLRIAMVCVMDESPAGLVPWMIVRTHPYAHKRYYPDGRTHRLHWQRGMFLRKKDHGEAMLELREREFHVYVEAVWPEFFMNVLRLTLQKLITDNWPGMQDRYYFAIPCRERINGRPCNGRFKIDALIHFLDKGVPKIHCQFCYKEQDIRKMLYGFVVEDSREQLARIETEIKRGFTEVKEEFKGLDSRIANYVMTILQAIASESKEGPRLFTIEPVDGNWHRLFDKRYKLHLWCENEGCPHPVTEKDKGVYEFDATRNWLIRVAPYANLVAGILKTMLPMVAPAINVYFGPKTVDILGIKDRLDLMKEATGKLLEEELKISDRSRIRQGVISERERSGVLALHALLHKLDPNHENLGLKRVPTYTGDFLWLCDKHYKQMQPKIPDKIE